MKQRKKSADNAPDERMLALIKAAGQAKMNSEEKEELWQRIHQHRQYRRIRPWYQTWKAAAAILLLAAAAWWAWPRSMHSALLQYAVRPVTDTAAAETQLILSNRQRVTLKGKNAAVTYRNRGAVVHINAGSYKGQEQQGGEAAYNTLLVPYGRRSTLTLQDGTIVWLNAGSRLVYPAGFAKDIREVYLEGEAYFDIAADAARPFFVYASDLKIKVLGTAFNVSAYKDDAQQSIVLAQGSVALEARQGPLRGKAAISLKPGGMAAYTAGDLKTATVNVATYTSWKEGHIISDNTALVHILKKLSRYYNEEIIVDQRSGQETFSGTLDLQKTMDEVLVAICAATSLRYERTGGKIFLKSKP